MRVSTQSPRMDHPMTRTSVSSLIPEGFFPIAICGVNIPWAKCFSISSVHVSARRSGQTMTRRSDWSPEMRATMRDWIVLPNPCSSARMKRRDLRATCTGTHCSGIGWLIRPAICTGAALRAVPSEWFSTSRRNWDRAYSLTSGAIFLPTLRAQDTTFWASAPGMRVQDPESDCKMSSGRDAPGPRYSRIPPLYISISGFEACSFAKSSSPSSRGRLCL